MPVDVTTNLIRVRQHSPGLYAEFRNAPLSKEQGISAVYGKKTGSDIWEIQSLLFDKAKWTLEQVKTWIAEHATFTWPGGEVEDKTQAEFDARQDDALAFVQAKIDDEPPSPDDDEITIPDEDLPKYVEVRQHPPGHFTGYRHKYLDKAAGIIQSLGTWKTTGAVAVQKLLFQRDKGWDDAKVTAWFQAHPEFHHPDRLVTQEAITNEITCTLQAVPGDKQFTVFDIVAMREGWGKNRRPGPDGQMYQDYFTPDFLQSLIPLMEGTGVQSVKVHHSGSPSAHLPPKVQLALSELQEHGHPSTMVNKLYDLGLEGNTIGLLKDVHYVPAFAAAGHADPGGAIVARLHLAADSPYAQHTRSLVKTAWENGLQGALGLSINYRAHADYTLHDGRPACIFTMATHYTSCEMVLNPAARGGVLNVVQGILPMQAELNLTPGQEDVTPPVPDDVKITQAVDPQEPPNPPADPPEPEDAAPAQPEKPAEPATQAMDEMRQRMNALEQGISALTKGFEAVTPVLGTLAQERTRANLTVAVTQSTLPKVVKDDLIQRIGSGDLTTDADLQRAMELSAKAVAAVQATQPAPVFPGMARSGAEVLKDPRDVNKIRSYLMWDLPLTQSEQDLANKYNIVRFRSLQDEYISLTGDSNLRFPNNYANFTQNVHPTTLVHSIYDDVKTFTQAIATGTYTDFLTHVINRSLSVSYNIADKSWMKMCYKAEPYTDNKPQDEWILGQFAEVPVVAEAGTYTELSYGAMQKVQTVSVKRGGLLIISEEAVQDDDLGYVKAAVKQIAIACNRTLAHATVKLLIGWDDTALFNGATMTDVVAGVLYSYANRHNYVNGSLENYDKIKELVDLMLTQTDRAADDGTQAPLVITPALFIAATNKIGYVRARVQMTDEPGRSDTMPNSLYLNISNENFVPVHPAFLHGHEEALFVLPNPNELAGMRLSFFRGMETPEMIWEGNQQPAYSGQLFASDSLRMRTKLKYRLGYHDLKAMYGLFLS